MAHTPFIIKHTFIDKDNKQTIIHKHKVNTKVHITTYYESLQDKTQLDGYINIYPVQILPAITHYTEYRV